MGDDAAKAFGQELFRLRKLENGLTMETICHESPISQTTLQKLEGGELKPSNRKYLTFFDSVFGVDNTVKLRNLFDSAINPDAAAQPGKLESTQSTSEHPGIHPIFGDPGTVTSIPIDRRTVKPGSARWQKLDGADVVVDEMGWDRTYRLLEVRRNFFRSETSDRAWSCVYRIHRIVKANWVAGLSTINESFTRDPNSIPTENYRPPQFEVLEVDRPQEQVTADPPTSDSYFRFRQAIRFDPTVAMGDYVDITTEAQMLNSTHAYRELVQAATEHTKLGQREFDYVSRVFAYPIQRVCYEIFLAHDLGAEPLGFEIRRAGQRLTDIEDRLRDEGAFTVREATVAGHQGIRMRLELDEPPLKMGMRLTWLPPSLGAS